MPNSIRLNESQRKSLQLSVGDKVQFLDGFGHMREARVKRAMKHHMASGLHSDEHVPCEIHDGPKPRPSRAKIDHIDCSARVSSFASAPTVPNPPSLVVVGDEVMN